MAVKRLQTVRLINDISDMVSSQRSGISINQDTVETWSTIIKRVLKKDYETSLDRHKDEEMISESVPLIDRH